MKPEVDRSTRQKENIAHHPFVKIAVFLVVFLISAVIYIYVVRSKIDPAAKLFLGVMCASLTSTSIVGWWFDRRSVASFGLRLSKIKFREVLFGFLIGAGLMSAIVLTIALTHGAQLGLLDRSRDTMHWFRLSLLIYLAGAVGEELAFRGFVFQTLELRWGSGVALLLTMAAFGAEHIMLLETGVRFADGLRGAVFLGLGLGLLLAAAYMVTRNLWLPIGIHWAWNLFQGPVYGARVSGIDMGRPIFPAVFSGPSWLTGGTFGPEASLPAVILTFIVGFVLLRQAVRHGEWRSLQNAMLPVQNPD